MISITALPDELLVKIFSHLDLPDVKSAGSVCEKWRSISQEIPKALCLQVSPYATPLDNSWFKRWKAITSYDLKEGCMQTIVDLRYFFDQGFRFAPNSQRTSFYQNEVILTDDSRSCIYGCNYLNKETRKLDVSVEGTIENIYCHKDSLVVLTSTSVTIYDLTAKEVRKVPLSAMGDLAEDLEACEVGSYDKNFLLLIGKKGTYTIDVTIDNLCASRLAIPIRIPSNEPQCLFASQKTIVATNLHGLDVFRRGEPESRMVRLPWIPFTWLHERVENIIDENFIAYSTPRFTRFIPVKIGTDFHLGKYMAEGVVDDPTREPPARIAIERSFFLPNGFQTTAVWSSREVCIVGLYCSVKGIHHFLLATWDYHKVKMIRCSEEVRDLLLVDGKILINTGRPKFQILDFTGANWSDAESISGQATLTSDFSSIKLKEAKNQVRVTVSFLLFDASLRLSVLVLTTYVALRLLRIGLRYLKNL